MKKNLESNACENGLEYVETTTGRNGYPENLRGAIIGFDNYGEAEKLARKYGLRITTLYRKDGWDLYERNGDTTYGPMEISAEDYGDDYSLMSAEDCEDFYENEVKPFLDAMESFDDLKAFISKEEELFEKLKSLDDGQVAVLRCGEYYETIGRELMKWSHDGKTWVIGVMEV